MVGSVNPSGSTSPQGAPKAVFAHICVSTLLITLVMPFPFLTVPVNNTCVGIPSSPIVSLLVML